MSQPPLGLDALQAVMHRLLRGELAPEAAAALLGLDAAQIPRLGLYQRFVRRHVQAALEGAFPRTLAALPAGTREALCDTYFATHAPTSYDLDAAAEAFPGFLEAALSEAPPGLNALHPCLAEVEWALLVAVRDEAEMPEPSAGAPVLNPTLSILQVPPAVAAALHGAALDAPPTAEQAEITLLVLRNPATGRAHALPANDDLLFALKLAHDGQAPRAAALAAGLDPDAACAAVARAAAAGLVIAPA